MKRPKPKAVDIALAAKLTMPADLYRLATEGEKFDSYSWRLGLEGTVYEPDRYACDWLIRFARQAGYKPTMTEMQRIERIMREGAGNG